MPALASAMGERKAIAAIIEAVAAGEITPGEARELTKLVEAFDKAIAAEELDERLRILEEKTGVTRS
jgi:predicted metal-dependent hydrolase